MSIATINDGKLIMKIEGEQVVRRCALPQDFQAIF